MQEVNERQSKQKMQQTNQYKSNSNKLFQEGRGETHAAHHYIHAHVEHPMATKHVER